MTRRILMALFALASSASVILAQAPTTTSTGVVRPSASATSAVSGFRTDLLAHFDDVNKKIVDLAAAVPAEKYAWRPSPGVRSFSEVFVHIAAGDSLLPSFLGAPKLEGINRDTEKTVTDKAKVIEILKASIANARASIANASDADLDKRVKFFGRDVTQRWILLQMLSHAHEHLGQAIAYARMNGIAPPWSEGPPAQPEKK
jgi:uncharacterized damage-inducible protein DinB